MELTGPEWALWSTIEYAFGFLCATRSSTAQAAVWWAEEGAKLAEAQVDSGV